MKLRQAVVLLALVLYAANVVSEETTPESTTTETATAPSVNTDVFTPEERASLESKAEKYQFQAEVNRLMDIIINSLYKNKEIFLREMISNAADALDKTRFQSLTDKSVLGEKSELEIKIKADPAAKTLTIIDSGLGMTKEGLIKYLGVVAKSGTTEFVEAVSKGGDSLSLIGQFGVGFYSVYLVADRVVVRSKHNDDPIQHVWESTADGNYIVAEDPRGNTLGRGTEITLFLKPDAEEFLNNDKLEKLVTRYSQFINFPIFLWSEKTLTKEVPVEEEPNAEEAEKEKEDKAAKKDDLEVSEEEDAEKKEEEKKPKTKTVTETVNEWKRLNTAKAIWTRNPKDVTKLEYQEFYQDMTKDTANPLDFIHFSAEGEISFRSLLFIPSKAESSLYDKYYEKSNALKLYVRRVLISDEFEDLLPRYMNFIKGVVDSEDLPLNVNRETLAQSRVLKVMGKKIVRKVLDMLRKLSTTKAEEGETESSYDKFYQQFSKSIKLGVIDDRSNKNKLAKLLRFQTSKSNGTFISLDKYIENMSKKQKFLYYITGESVAQVEKSPFLERLRKKGLEVLYMTDALDEYVTQALTDYDGKTLMSVTKEGLKLDDDDKDQLKKYEDDFKPLTDWLKKSYGEKVEKVAVSIRLTDSPCALVTGQYGWSANMERIMKAQTFADPEKHSYMISKKTMEINPRHPIIKELLKRVNENADDEGVKDLADLMFDGALIASGFSMANAAEFASRINRVIGAGLSVDITAVEQEPEPVAEEPKKEESSEETTQATSDAAPAEETTQATSDAAPTEAPPAETASESSDATSTEAPAEATETQAHDEL